MRCYACDGEDAECGICAGVGQVKIDGCIMDYITPDIVDVLMAADLAREGSWPAAGGWRDQAHQLVEAVRCAWRDEAALIEERK